MPGRPTLLVLGGSQGAMGLNTRVLEGLPACRGLDFQVLHCAGQRDAARVRSTYEELGLDACVVDFLPERRYEDWTSGERERLLTLAMEAMTTLAELLVASAPFDSLQLAQRVLASEPLWEPAYRVQMQAYQATGNRPMALRAYQQCVQTLQEGFAIEPLPETQELHNKIRAGS